MVSINTRLSNIADALEACNAPNQRNRLVLNEISDDEFSLEVKSQSGVRKWDNTDLKSIILKVSHFILKIDATNAVFSKEIVDVSILDKIKEQSESLEKRYNDKIKPLQQILFCCRISSVNMAFTDLSYNLSHSTPKIKQDNEAIKKEWNKDCKEVKHDLTTYIFPYAKEVLKFYETHVELPEDHVIRKKMQQLKDIKEKLEPENLDEVFLDSNNLERFRFINRLKNEMKDLNNWFKDVKRFNSILEQLGKKQFTTTPTFNQLKKINE